MIKSCFKEIQKNNTGNFLDGNGVLQEEEKDWRRVVEK